MFSRDRPKAVILDTNMLIFSAKLPFDIAHALRKQGFETILVPSFVASELESIAAYGRPKERKFAKLALEIAKNFDRLDEPSAVGEVDEKLFSLAKTGKYVIATADTPLRRRLIREGLDVVYLKDGLPVIG